MEKTEHVLLTGDGAAAFARSAGFAFEDDAYFYNELRYQQWQEALKDDRVQLDHTEKEIWHGRAPLRWIMPAISPPPPPPAA